MKRYLLTFLILLIAGAALGAWLLHDPGYVLVSRGFVSVEMNLWVAALFWLFSVAITLITIDLLLGLFGIGDWWARWKGLRRQKSSSKDFQEGIQAFEQGDRKTAERLLFNAARLATHPLPAWIAAAEAAAKSGAFDRSEQYFVLAEEKGNQLAVSLARARLLQEHERLEQAEILLDRLREQHPKDSFIARQLMDVLQQLKQWEKLSLILPDLPKPSSEDQGQFIQTTRLACRDVFLWVVQTGGQLDRPHTQQKLKQYWGTLPRTLHQDSEIVAHYANALVKAGADDDAETLLSSQLDNSWSNAAIEIYGRTRSLRPDEALAKALRWKEKHPHNPALLFALGRLSLQNRQWAEARDYLEASLAVHHSPEVHAELLRLLMHCDKEAAERMQANAVAAQIAHLPNFPLP